MRKQNPLVVFLLTFITFGFYAFFWYARTRGEMNRLGANVPTTWLIIVPFVNLYYLWKWSEGVDIVSHGKTSGILAFILQFFLGAIGMAIVQDTFNGVEAVGATGGASSPMTATPAAQAVFPQSQPVAAVSQNTPVNTFGEQPQVLSAPAVSEQQNTQPPQNPVQ